MSKQLLLGDEAIAQAALDAGLSGVYAYPGTPSTEITEYIQMAPITTEQNIHNRWCTNEKTAMEAAFWVLIGTYLWKNIGYDSILWSSGLDSISTDLYEAAAVDGASGWRQFTAITLPNLLPTLAVTLVLSLLNTFKVFREAYLVAGAYPEKSIYLLQHLFNNWFLALDLPRLSAAAILMAGALGAVIAVCIKRL